jgi:hypothetical protein
MYDAMLTDFKTSIADKNFERAAKLLEQQGTGPETEVLWMSLCYHALDDVKLDIAERCWDRLNNAARAEFLRKTMGMRQRNESLTSVSGGAVMCNATKAMSRPPILTPSTAMSSSPASILPDMAAGPPASTQSMTKALSAQGTTNVSTVQPPTNTSSSGSENEEYLFLMDPEQELDEDEVVDLLKSHGLSDNRIRKVLHRLSLTSRCSSTQNGPCGS